jgi:hypothetical protein
MIRKKEKQAEREQMPSDGDGQVMALLNQIVKTQEEHTKAQGEFRERLDDVEKKGGVSNEAQVLVAKLVYNTPRELLPAFTSISLRMVDPFSLADTCAAILTDKVQSGEVSLPEVRRASIYLHLKSVKGLLVNKGAELALQQEVNKPEGLGEPLEIGKGG